MKNKLLRLLLLGAVIGILGTSCGAPRPLAAPPAPPAHPAP
ncbi:hypothetical protein [Mucilaginibacter sp. dw_454]|nr:hypothetical protein [Mucilaginibacter sp. dw_454]